MNTADFRFYGSLNDFLPPAGKNGWIVFSFRDHPAVKDSMEAIGVPHVEVNEIFINDIPAGFYKPLEAHDRVEVYPLVVTNNSPGKFVLDVHLGKLARLLRLLGIDALYDRHFTDRAIVTRALEGRIVLTRDIGLLKYRDIAWGYWLRSQEPTEQVKEVLLRFALREVIRPFSRCMACNGSIEPVEKEKILPQLEKNTAAHFREFYQCRACKKIYWKGSHYGKMLAMIEKLVG